jgi:hypothetical protein
MKKLLLALFVTVSSTALVSAQETKPAAPAPEDKNKPDITFEKEVHDFGTITEGTQATFEFKFTNSGIKDPLIITNVQASCGCTTPSYTKEPVDKKKSGVIKAVYNSSGRPGAFTKTITVTSNARGNNSVKILTIKGVVEKAPAAPVNNENSPVNNK